MSPQVEPIQVDPLTYRLDDALFGRLSQPRFRGNIYDYARNFELGSSYEVPKDNLCKNCRANGIRRCRHFEIETARQLIGPFQAIRDDNVRTVMVLKATQTLGSLVWDLALHWFIVHSVYQTMIVYLDADDKAQSYCDKRLMPTLKNNPDIQPFIPTGVDRHDATKTDIKFTNGKIIRICGLNESNASSLTWQVVVIDEGWLHFSDGLMQKAIDRAKQVENRKIIIIGQAGEADEDQDKIWKSLNKRVPLTFACPVCNGRQEFSFTKARPEDFKPIFREGFEPPKAGTYYGLTVPQKFSEITDIKAAAKEAYYECLHCGHHIADTKENRAAMMATYEQDWKQNGIVPPNYEVGFWNPDPASVTLPFAQTMTAYIKAKKEEKEFGRKQGIKDFYQNRWATAWNVDLIERRDTLVSPGSYDPAQLQELIANAHSINMTVDCQEDGDHKQKTGASITGWFWVVVRVWGKDSKSKQIARFYCKSWAAWIAVQKHWNIPNDRVMIDCLFDPVGVRNKAVEQRQLVKLDKPHPIFKTMEKVVTWKLLQAVTRQNNWKHKDGKERPWSEEQRDGGYIVNQKTGRPEWITVPKILFNKNPIRQQVDALYTRSPGLPDFEYLERAHLKLPDGTPDTLTLNEETGKRTYQSQMAAQSYNIEKHKYVEDSPDDHYYWCEQAQVVRAGMDGLLGLDAVFQSSP